MWTVKIHGELANIIAESRAAAIKQAIGALQQEANPHIEIEAEEEA